jgi:hypothetical protein
MVCGACVRVSCDWPSGGSGGGLSAAIYCTGRSAPVSNSSMSLSAVSATNNTAGKVH